MSENERKACPEWCGGQVVPDFHNTPHFWGTSAGKMGCAWYCAQDCADAGRPLNPQIKNGTDALVKPTEVRVGQRWRTQTGLDYVVTAERGSDVVGRRFTCDFSDGDPFGTWLEENILKDSFLGYAEPTPPQEVKPAEAQDPERCIGLIGLGCACNMCSGEQAPPKPAPPQVIRREVWAGGQWLDYSYLGNGETAPEPFDSFERRRMFMSDGTHTEWRREKPRDPGPAITRGDAAGAAAAALVTKER